MHLPSNIIKKLNERLINEEYRSLKNYSCSNIDFFSNDYLGVVKNFDISDLASLSIIEKAGATGSRLISGNSIYYDSVETYLANFYQSEASLLFASGYLANIGLLSCLALEDDLILFDEFSHASIRDGIKLSKANSMSFNHNDLNDLENKLKNNFSTCYVVVESLYSMDGDFSLLKEIDLLCEKYNAYLIIDEAHTTGIYGKYGEGLSLSFDLKRSLARIHTFGKAIGSHGAVIVGSKELKNYLINFCRSFIYTTGLSDLMLNHIKTCHEIITNYSKERKDLDNNINYFNKKIVTSNASFFLKSTSPIQGILGNKNDLKKIELLLEKNLFNAKAIYSPSVPRGKERIRFSLHSFNTETEIDLFFNLIETNIL